MHWHSQWHTKPALDGSATRRFFGSLSWALEPSGWAAGELPVYYTECDFALVSLNK